MLENVQRLLQQSSDALIRTRHERSQIIVQAVSKIEEVLRRKGKLFICGNGGSAADAQHLAAELVGKYLLDRPALPVFALTTNSSTLTAIGDDYSFADIFSRQIEAYGAGGDMLWAISTSGNSENVLKALTVARRMGIYCLGMTGAGGGKMSSHVDLLLDVPSIETPRIQECHIAAGHIICGLVESQLFG